MKDLKTRELYILYRALRDLKSFDTSTSSKISHNEVSSLTDKVDKELQIKY